VTYGTTYVDQSKIFTTILQKELPGKLGKRVEVLNASKGGWAVGNELAYLRSRGTFDADVIVLVLNTGDLIQEFTGGSPIELDGHADPRPISAIGELCSRYVGPRLLHREPPRDAGSVASTEPSLDIDKLTTMVFEQLEEAHGIARAAGARFAIVMTRARGEWDDPQYQHAIDLLHRWASDQQVPLLDMGERFSHYPGDEVYLDTIHLRPKGHELVAQGILQEWNHLTSPSASAVSASRDTPGTLPATIR
jgi:hypothetical protein